MKNFIMDAHQIKKQDEELTRKIGERLRLALQSSSFTAKKLKEITTTSNGAFNSYLKGEIKASAVKLVRFAEVLHVNFLWLITGDGPMKKSEHNKNQILLDQSIVAEILQEKAPFFANKTNSLDHRSKMFIKYYELKSEEKLNASESDNL